MELEGRIRILVVDDHPAMRAGLMAVLRAEAGLVALDAATSDSDLWPTLNRTKPDVVVLDYHLPGDDGLVLCRRIKRQVPAPAVLLYSAYADAALTIPARLAGVDGLVGKSAPANELYDELTTKNENWKKVYEPFRQFRGEQYLWWQVAEYTFDNFMIRARARG